MLRRCCTSSRPLRNPRAIRGLEKARLGMRAWPVLPAHTKGPAIMSRGRPFCNHGHPLSERLCSPPPLYGRGDGYWASAEAVSRIVPSSASSYAGFEQAITGGADMLSLYGTLCNVILLFRALISCLRKQLRSTPAPLLQPPQRKAYGHFRLGYSLYISSSSARPHVRIFVIENE